MRQEPHEEPPGRIWPHAVYTQHPKEGQQRQPQNYLGEKAEPSSFLARRPAHRGLW